MRICIWAYGHSGTGGFWKVSVCLLFPLQSAHFPYIPRDWVHMRPSPAIAFAMLDAFLLKQRILECGHDRMFVYQMPRLAIRSGFPKKPKIIYVLSINPYKTFGFSQKVPKIQSFQTLQKPREKPNKPKKTKIRTLQQPATSHSP